MSPGAPFAGILANLLKNKQKLPEQPMPWYLVVLLATFIDLCGFVIFLAAFGFGPMFWICVLAVVAVQLLLGWIIY